MYFYTLSIQYSNVIMFSLCLVALQSTQWQFKKLYFRNSDSIVWTHSEVYYGQLFLKQIAKISNNIILLLNV